MLQSGGSMSYSKPVNLPVELPTKFELVINFKAAKELGIAVLQTLLVGRRPGRRLLRLLFGDQHAERSQRPDRDEVEVHQAGFAHPQGPHPEFCGGLWPNAYNRN